MFETGFVHCTINRKKSEWLDCDCNINGTVDASVCDQIGTCSCKKNVTGSKCEDCEAALYPFPNCNKGMDGKHI